MKNIQNFLEGTRYEKHWSRFLVVLSISRLALPNTKMSEAHLNEVRAPRLTFVVRDGVEDLGRAVAQGHQDGKKHRSKADRAIEADVWNRSSSH